MGSLRLGFRRRRRWLGLGFLLVGRDRGGRLYNTALAIMILEVYYRHMPLYSEKAVDGKF